jgi:triosephosphate isomerase
MVTPESSGAFTGGISPPMLKSIGVQWALAGHSERRTINNESDEFINAQCVKLIENDMSVILCIGETLDEFECSLAGPVCEIQLKKGLAGISAEDMNRVAIAVSTRIASKESLLSERLCFICIDDSIYAVSSPFIVTLLFILV